METLTEKLIEAVKTEDEVTVQDLLHTAGLDVKRAINLPHHDTSAVVQACIKGNTTILKFLLDSGGDVNSRSSSGKTCLMYATTNQHPQCVKILLDYGADVKLTDSHQQTAATLAINNESSACLRILLERGSCANHQDEYGISLLTEAISREKLAHAEIIIQHGADLNLQDSTGMTALHWAASLGRERSIKLLHQRGANLNPQSNDGKTPLIKAIGENQFSCIRALLKLGCDTRISSFNGWAPIIHAAKQQHKYLDLFIQFQKDCIQFEINGQSALVHAIQASNTPNVRLLIRKGAPVKNVTEANFSAQTWGTQEMSYVHLSIAAGVQCASFENHTGYSTNILPHYSEKINGKTPCALEKLCRHALRIHLLNMNSNSNLYCLVHDLPLPEPVRDFLMFHVGIDNYFNENEELNCSSIISENEIDQGNEGNSRQ